MEAIAVVLDDAEHAHRMLGPLLSPGGPPVQWLVLPRPPGLGRRIGRWLPAAARAAWREDWCTRQQQALQPLFDQAPAGSRVDWCAARAPLPQALRTLRLQHGAGLRVLDARLPRLGQSLEPLAPQPGDRPRAGRRFALPLALGSALSLVLAWSD